MEYEWWSAAVKVVDELKGKTPAGTGFSGAVPKWWRLQKEYKNPSLLFCDTCIEPRLWSRQVCQECGTRLHQMTNEDALKVFIKNIINGIVYGLLSEKKKIDIK